MRRTTVSASIAAVMVVTVLGGCGSDTASSSDSGSGSSSASSSGTGSASQPSAEEPESAETPSKPPSETSEPQATQDTVTVEISIQGGEVDPAGQQVEASVGQTVVLVVDSDASEELHVHSAPDDHEFAIEPGQNQRFRFPVELPGQFDVETHDTGVLVAQLVVRP